MNTSLVQLASEGSEASVCGQAFQNACSLVITLPLSRSSEKPAVVTVTADEDAYSFVPAQVTREYPVYLPCYGAAVTLPDDGRDYAEIAREIAGRGLKTQLEKIEEAPEETYKSACQRAENRTVETFLGTGRDMRIFSMGFRDKAITPDCVELLDWIQPRNAGTCKGIGRYDKEKITYRYMVGKGIGMQRNIKRWLEDDRLPILHARIVDDDIHYHVTAFVSLTENSLTRENLHGTHFLVADSFGAGCMQTADQQEITAAEREKPAVDNTALFIRIEAVNTADTPQYAFMKWFEPNGTFAPSNQLNKVKFSYDREKGFGKLENGEVFCVAKLDNQPMICTESAVLVYPGKPVCFDGVLPHGSIGEDAAEKLTALDFSDKYQECRRFWEETLAEAAAVWVPEKVISDNISAGLLHMDLITYGEEPAGPVAPSIGEYCPIGTESAPIIQAYDSMGMHQLAKRSIDYFLKKQHADGFIQNFGGYMLETGAVLWTIGEHYRYTRDAAWAREIEAQVLKSCRYLKEWMEQNKTDQLHGNGYGMLRGKVADPEDEERVFMLNGYAYLGLSRAAEMLADIRSPQAAEVFAQAQELKGYIRDGFQKALSDAIAVPLSNGTWCPAVAPWVGINGPVCLHMNVDQAFTHGSINLRDSLLGPLHLVFQEVLAPDEPAVDLLLDYHTELFFTNNAAYSQPYYSVHPWVHLKRGEVKAFLKAYYNTLAGMQDRETKTFLEHSFTVTSPHKTHEEAWYLMQTRWMLYLEEADTLKLFPGVPEAWYESGRTIAAERVGSYFGHLSFRLVMHEDDTADLYFACERPAELKKLSVRICPPGRKIIACDHAQLIGCDRIEVVAPAEQTHVKIYLKPNETPEKE